jgi:hypothetical protein
MTPEQQKAQRIEWIRACRSSRDFHETKTHTLPSAQHVSLKVFAANRGAAPETVPLPLALNIQAGDAATASKQLMREIYRLRTLNYDAEMVEHGADGAVTKTLIKYQDQANVETGKHSPMQSLEGHIQAMKFMHGYLQIAEHSHNTEKSWLMKLGYQALSKYQVLFEAAQQKTSRVEQVQASVDAMHWLFDALSKNLTLKSDFTGMAEKKAHDLARKHLMAARDLALLLDVPGEQTNHHSVITITERADHQVTAQFADAVKIGDEFYSDDANFEKSIRSTEEHTQADTVGAGWVRAFFNAQKSVLQSFRYPVASSARFLPMPANTQTNESLYCRENLLQGGLSVEARSQFVRIAIATPFAMKNTADHLPAATKSVASVLNAVLPGEVEFFKSLYGAAFVGPDGKPTYGVEYETLLSPFRLEAKAYGLGHRDNNSAFVQMKAQALRTVAQDHASALPDLDGSVNPHFYSSTSSINKRAGVRGQHTPSAEIEVFAEQLSETLAYFKFLSAQDGIWAEPKDKLKFDKCLSIIEAGQTSAGDLAMIENMVNRLKSGKALNGVSELAQRELGDRLQASLALKKLIDNQPLFKALQPYQYNILRSALADRALGNAAVKLRACKSARDRTLVQSAANRVLAHHPELIDQMLNFDEIATHATSFWAQFQKHLINEILSGHEMRGMDFHVAFAKVSAVHGDLFAALPDDIQAEMNALKPFCKNPGEFPEEKRSTIVAGDDLRALGQVQMLSLACQQYEHNLIGVIGKALGSKDLTPASFKRGLHTQSISIAEDNPAYPAYQEYLKLQDLKAPLQNNQLTPDRKVERLYEKRTSLYPETQQTRSSRTSFDGSEARPRRSSLLGGHRSFSIEADKLDFLNALEGIHEKPLTAPGKAAKGGAGMFAPASQPRQRASAVSAISPVRPAAPTTCAEQARAEDAARDAMADAGGLMGGHRVSPVSAS